MMSTNLAFLSAQLLNIIILAVWVILGLAALFDIRKQSLQPLPKAIWVALILLVPALGALAYWIVRPTGNPS